MLFDKCIGSACLMTKWPWDALRTHAITQKVYRKTLRMAQVDMNISCANALISCTCCQTMCLWECFENKHKLTNNSFDNALTVHA
jgi:hypothetical protein